MRSEQQVTEAISRYGDMVMRLCTIYLKNESDSEDVFQTVFLKYALYPREFENLEHEKAWIIRVTVNACKDLLKSFFRRYTVSLEEIRTTAPDITQEQYSVMEAVLSLPKTYREVIYLHYYEGYSAPEISRILRKNVNTIYTHLHRAKELLKDLLRGDDFGE